MWCPTPTEEKVSPSHHPSSTNYKDRVSVYALNTSLCLGSSFNSPHHPPSDPRLRGEQRWGDGNRLRDWHQTKEGRKRGKGRWEGGREEWRRRKHAVCRVALSISFSIKSLERNKSRSAPFGLSCSLRFSHFLCLNLMWKASCMPLLITNNPGNSSMPFLQLYFLYCSNKINGGNPNNFS